MNKLYIFLLRLALVLAVIMFLFVVYPSDKPYMTAIFNVIIIAVLIVLNCKNID